jgi:hypothetical protein
MQVRRYTRDHSVGGGFEISAQILSIKPTQRPASSDHMRHGLNKSPLGTMFWAGGFTPVARRFQQTLLVLSPARRDII